MKDMLPEASKKDQSPADEAMAAEIGKLLTDHRGESVIVMDMRRLDFWTDFFVIATVTSGVHLSGLDRQIKEFVRDRDYDVFRRSRKPDIQDEWSIIDLGNIVIHLMTSRARSFYELERLWPAPVIYSSKSS